MIHPLNLNAAAENWIEITTNYGTRKASLRTFVVTQNLGSGITMGTHVRLVSCSPGGYPIDTINSTDATVNICKDGTTHHVPIDCLQAV